MAPFTAHQPRAANRIPTPLPQRLRHFTQVVIPQQRLVFRWPVPPIRLVHHLRAYPAEHRQNLHRVSQVPYQRRRVVTSALCVRAMAFRCGSAPYATSTSLWKSHTGGIPSPPASIITTFSLASSISVFTFRRIGRSQSSGLRTHYTQTHVKVREFGSVHVASDRTQDTRRLQSAVRPRRSVPQNSAVVVVPSPRHARGRNTSMQYQQLNLPPSSCQ